MRQCFAIECLNDGEWSVALWVIGTRRELEPDIPEYAEMIGITPECIRLRWIWTTDEANELRERGIKAFERSGGPIAWVG